MMKTSRRSFLKAAAAVAAPLVVSSNTICQCAVVAGETLPNSIVRTGLIGVGRQCWAHNIPLLTRVKTNSVCAVCDVFDWRIEQAANKLTEIYQKSVSLKHVAPKEIKRYKDYQEMLADSSIDAVMISTNDDWHARMAVEAMKAGKHASVEKPTIRTLAEGQAIVKTSAETGKKFRSDSEFRSQKGAHKAAELIRNGVLGKINKVTVTVPGDACLGNAGYSGADSIFDTKLPLPEQPVPAGLDWEKFQGNSDRKFPYHVYRCTEGDGDWGRPFWMSSLDYTDGSITNWGTHDFDGAMWALDLDRTFPNEIIGEGKYRPAEFYVNVLPDFKVTYRYKNEKYPEGLEVIYQGKDGDNSVVVEGEKGTISFSFDWGSIKDGISANPESLLDTKLGESAIRFPLRTDKEDFIHAILTDTETLEPAITAHCTTSTMLLGHISIRTGEKIKFDPKKEEFIDSPKSSLYFDKRILTPGES